MESAKPIEPGCMALVLRMHPSWAGFIPSIVQVKDRCLAVPNNWYLDIKHPLDPMMGVHTHENTLVRIDDPDLQKQIESEREKVLVVR